MIIDASVAAKWLLPESGQDLAKALLRSNTLLIAPPLIRIEVAAAITKATRLGGLKTATTTLLCDTWFEWLTKGIIKLDEKQEDYAAAAKLAHSLSHPYQDCLYIAMAKRLARPLVSADKKQVQKAESAGVNTSPFSPEHSDNMSTGI